MGYDDDGNFRGYGSESNRDHWNRISDQEESNRRLNQQIGNRNNSGGGCIITLLLIAGSGAFAALGMYQLLC